MNSAADAMERVLMAARAKAVVLRATRAWEAWIILGSLAYLAGHIVYWLTVSQ